MLDLSQTKSFYPPNLHAFSAFLLREYLQHRILCLLFRSDFAQKFALLGGTCLRIVCQSNRFSEDWHFNNFGLTHVEFEQVAQAGRRDLEPEGHAVDMENVFRGACY